MSKLVLPQLNSLAGSFRNIRPEDWCATTAIARWNQALAAKSDNDEEGQAVTLDIYDFIGSDWMGNGWTAKRAASILRNNKGKPVTVNINSPGGDVFEGIAIYNLLRAHDAEVTTRVIGMAASAASLIAMAGGEIQSARTGFMMIHNVWVLAIGNRNDLRDAADQLEAFDDALAGAYADRTGMDKSKVAKLMDKETWFSGEQALENGFADALLPADIVEETGGEERASRSLAIRSMEVDLMKAGYSRTAARAKLKEYNELLGTPDAAGTQDGGTPDAAPQATPDAGEVEAKTKQISDSFLESVTP